MKYKVFPASEGESFDLEDLEWMQDALQATIEGLASILGDSSSTAFVISGVTGSPTVSDGWLYYQGELIRFKESTFQSTIVIRDEEVNAGEGDYEKWAECGTGAITIDYADLVRLPSVNNLLQKGVTFLELKSYTAGVQAEVALVRKVNTSYIQIGAKYTISASDAINIYGGFLSVGDRVEIG